MYMLFELLSLDKVIPKEGYSSPQVLYGTMCQCIHFAQM
jgi:hypothetical protein